MRKKPLILLILVVALIIGSAVIYVLDEPAPSTANRAHYQCPSTGEITYEEIVFSPLMSILS